MLSENLGQAPEAFYLDYFELRDGELYDKGKSMSGNDQRGELRSISFIADILDKEGMT